MNARLTLFAALLLVATDAHAQKSGLTLADVLDAAVRQQPEVALAAEHVMLERAALGAAASAFETQVYGSIGGGGIATPLSALESPNGVMTTLGRSYQQYEVGVRKRFRSGLEISPSVQMTRNAYDGVMPHVTTGAGLALAYPVIGARTRDASVAAEAAAAERVRGADLDRVRAEEEAVAAAAIAYWEYVGAVRVLDGLAVAESRAAHLLAETETLVAADERPAADLVVLRADLARRRAARLEAEQAVFDARQRVSLAMGGTAEDAAQLALPAEALPAIPDVVLLDEALLVEQALAGRADLLAAARRLSSAGRTARAAEADRLPSVDLVLEGRYSALSEGDMTPQQYLPFGLDATRGGQLGLSVRVNRLGSGAARASAERARADRTRLQIVHDDLARRIQAEVASAVAALRSGAAGVEQTRQAVTLYQQVVDNEQQRLRLGMGTLFDVQIAEERLANARTDAVYAEVRFAGALVRLHVAAGLFSARNPAVTARQLRDLSAASHLSHP